jgi:hypothetical protein
MGRNAVIRRELFEGVISHKDSLGALPKVIHGRRQRGPRANPRNGGKQQANASQYCYANSAHPEHATAGATSL